MRKDCAKVPSVRRPGDAPNALSLRAEDLPWTKLQERSVLMRAGERKRQTGSVIGKTRRDLECGFYSQRIIKRSASLAAKPEQKAKQRVSYCATRTKWWVGLSEVSLCKVVNRYNLVG